MNGRESARKEFRLLLLHYHLMVSITPEDCPSQFDDERQWLYDAELVSI